VSSANTHDSQLLLPLLDSIAPIRSPRGRPRCRLGKLHADKAYDQPAPRAEIRRRGIAVRIARKGVESSQHLGRHRWIKHQPNCEQDCPQSTDTSRTT